jgi:LacI family transcriptional regulator
VEEVADQAGCVLMMGYTSDSLERQTRILQAMIEYRLDGIVLSPASRTSTQDLLPLRQSAVPHVLVTRRIRNHPADYVGPDNVAAGQLLAAHLAEIGVRSVALLGGPVGVSARSEREKGLRSELPRHGIAWRPELSIPSHADSEGGVVALRQLLTTRPLPDALVGYNDTVVRGIFGELRRTGIEPGTDVAVVGFDNSPEAAHMHPELTSVDTFMARVGRTAGQQVLERVAELDKAITTVLVQPELQVRASTAAWTGAMKRPAKQGVEPAVSA